jgi:hypothetical protein
MATNTNVDAAIAALEDAQQALKDMGGVERQAQLAVPRALIGVGYALAALVEELPAR